jgi:phosphoserine phosphatase RsbU/P
MVYDQPAPRNSRPVMFIDDSSGKHEFNSTVVTSLAGVLEDSDTSPTSGSRRTQKVTALIKAGNELARQRPLPELFEMILDLSIDAVSAERGVLMTLEGEELVVRATRGENFRISATVRDQVVSRCASILVRDTQMDDAFKAQQSIVGQNTRSLMAVPLQSAERLTGLIYVDSPSRLREFTKDDLGLLTVMANVAANRVEHVRFAELEQIRQLMARDLDQAAEIQRRYLPPDPPKMRTLDVAGYNAPCRTVGGDYFDFVQFSDERIAMVLGDVSGKGMPASLLMMGLQARVQVLLDETKDLGATMTRINDITTANCPDNRFITFFASLVDGNTGKVSYACAGHNPPVIVKPGGEFRTLDGGGPVLGILPNIHYEEYHAQLEPGEALVIYSDGVTEAASPEDEEFDIPILAKAVAAHIDKPASQMIMEVNQALLRWTKGAPATDDITMIIARRLA